MTFYLDLSILCYSNGLLWKFSVLSSLPSPTPPPLSNYVNIFIENKMYLLVFLQINIVQCYIATYRHEVVVKELFIFIYAFSIISVVINNNGWFIVTRDKCCHLFSVNLIGVCVRGMLWTRLDTRLTLVQHFCGMYISCVTLKLKKKKKKNVNLGCLKHWVVCAQWYMYLFASEKYTMFISLDSKGNHNVNVCSQNESQFCCNHYNWHPGLKRLYSSAKTKPVYYTNTRDFSRISN